MRIRVLDNMCRSIAVLAFVGAQSHTSQFTPRLYPLSHPISHLRLLQRDLGPFVAGRACSPGSRCCARWHRALAPRQRAASVLVRLARRLWWPPGLRPCSTRCRVQLWRGVEALAGRDHRARDLISRLVFERVVSQEIFKRRILVRAGTAAAPGGAAPPRPARLRAGGFVQLSDEPLAVPAGRVRTRTRAVRAAERHGGGRHG
jgi:hypothetical protein